MPGYVKDRAELARWLASADIYVSAMADETFGVSIIEAQASGLPVVGVAAGAMIDRVTDAIGRLGPVGDADAMARNILAVWNGDRAAMAEQARAHALQFSWDRSMEALFGQVYPAAFERRRGQPIGIAGAASARRLTVQRAIHLIFRRDYRVRRKVECPDDVACCACAGCSGCAAAREGRRIRRRRRCRSCWRTATRTSSRRSSK